MPFRANDDVEVLPNVPEEYTEYIGRRGVVEAPSGKYEAVRFSDPLDFCFFLADELKLVKKVSAEEEKA